MSLLFTIGIGYVLKIPTPTQLPLAEQVFLCLVVIPFTLMYLTGLSHRADIRAAIAVLALAIVILSMRSLLLLFPVATDTIPRLIATAVIWMGMGYYAGIVCRSYLRSVRWTGYLFTIGLNLIAIALGAIVSEIAVLALTQIGKAVEISNIVSNINSIVSNYVVFLVIGVFLLMVGKSIAILRWGRQLTMRPLRRLLSIFTVFGILSFAIEQLYSTFLYHIFWWAPHVEPPFSYLLFATFALGLIAAFPSYEPSEETLSEPIKIDEETGILIALDREECLGTAEEPLKLAHFTYHPPKGWTEESRSRTSTEYLLSFRPPSGWLSRKLSFLKLMVYQYGEERAFDEVQFKRNTYMNLKGQDATIVEEKMGRRHGVVSHECKFKWGSMNYGYLVRFITRGNEFVIIWTSISGETYRRYLPDVEQFIESFQFVDPDTKKEV